MRDEILHIKNLSFRFAKDKLLFSGFNLNLHVSEIKVVVGESGIGKSTLFELITGTLKPLSGEIRACPYIRGISRPIQFVSSKL